MGFHIVQCDAFGSGNDECNRVCSQGHCCVESVSVSYFRFGDAEMIATGECGLKERIVIFLGDDDGVIILEVKVHLQS